MRILIADDDRAIHALIQRDPRSSSYQWLSAFDGDEAVCVAAAEKPDLILLDINMPKKNGREVLGELRNRIETRMIPVIILTGNGTLADQVEGFGLGADDYIAKPFHMEELQARVAGIFRRTKRDLAASPLTRLPGGPAIEDDVNRRLEAAEPFAFFYLDIDNFKAFNDVYGFASGDRVIAGTAGLLLEIVKTLGRPDDFLGHVGGDDFVLISRPSSADRMAAEIAQRFDGQSPSYYNEDDRLRGAVMTRDRQGNVQSSPLMTLSIAIVTNEDRRIGGYGELVDTAMRIKRSLKSSGIRNKSASSRQP